MLFAIVACTDNDTDDNTLRDTVNIGDANRSDNRSLDREEDFVLDVLEANAEEIAWLKEGTRKGTHPEIKSQAQQMITEHEKLNQDLRGYAKKKNFRLDNIDTTKTAKLNEDAGNEWDEEWADEIGDRHRMMIRTFERAQTRVQDAELRDMISKTLPSMRSHLDKTEQLETKLDVQNDRK
jgi:putative membrane protein